MSRKQCRRKVWALVNPIKHATEGASITPSAELDKLRLRELASVDAFANDRVERSDFDNVCAMLNLCEHMAKNGVGPEAIETCESVQYTLVRCAADFDQTGKAAMTADEVSALRDLYQFHDLQRQSVPRSEYERAIMATFNKVRSKAPGVIEV